MSFDDIPENLRKAIKRMDPHQIIEYMDKVYRKVEALDTMLSMQKNILEYAKIEAANIFAEAERPLKSIKTSDGKVFSVRVDTYFSGMSAEDRMAFCKKPTIKLGSTKEEIETEKQVLQEMVKETVNAKTFESWLRGRNKEGHKLPQQVKVTTVARVVRTKA